MRVVITVPHAPCPEVNYGHLCDVIAPAAAKELLAETRQLGLDVVLLIAEIHRDPTQDAVDGKKGRDQNRPVGRGTPFRRSIVEEIKSGAGIVYVIDMHSFSEDAFKNTDVGIMDPTLEGAFFFNWTDYAKSARDFLAATTTLRVNMIPGSMENDIVVTSRVHGAKSFLVEINEDLSKEKRTIAIKQLAQWLKNQDVSQKSPGRLIIW